MHFEGDFIHFHDEELQSGNSWTPVTPAKPLPARSQPVLLGGYGSYQERTNWQLGNPSTQFLQSVPNQYGTVQGPSLIQRAEHVTGGNGETNGMVSFVQPSYGHTIRNGSTSATAGLLTYISGNASASEYSSITLGTNAGIQNGPLIPNLHSYLYNQGASSLSSLLHSNGSQPLGSNSSVHCNGFHQISNYPFSEPSTCTYDLNLPPRIEDHTNSSTALLTTGPVPPEEFRKHDKNQASLGIQSMNKSKEQDLVQLTEKDISQQTCDGLLQNIVDSSSTVLPIQSEQSLEKVNNEVFDLNKTPMQKPSKRRKHRPKVIIEGKPKRTAKAATKKRKDSNNNPPQKRKYVRRKGLSEQASQKSDTLKETADHNAKATAKSCRRSLNFDSERSKDEISGNITVQEEMQQSNQYQYLDPRYQGTALHPHSDNDGRMRSLMQISQHNRSRVANQPAGPPPELTSQITYVEVMPEKSVLQPCHQGVSSLSALAKDLNRKNLTVVEIEGDTENVHPCKHSSKLEGIPVWQHVSSGIIDQTVLQVPPPKDFQRSAQIMSHNTPQSAVKSSQSYHEARGSKREYNDTSEQTLTHSVTPMCRIISDADGRDRYSGGISAASQGIQKKMKMENGPGTKTNGAANLTVLEDGLRQVETNSAAALRPQMKHLEFNSTRTQNNAVVSHLTGASTNPPLTVDHYLPWQHNSSKPDSCTERMASAKKLTQVQTLNFQTAVDKQNLTPLNPAIKKPVGKKYVRTTPAKKSVPEDDVLQEQDPSKKYPQTPTRKRGRPVSKKQHNFIDEVIRQLSALDINEINNQYQNALVPYIGSGTIIPYEGKKRRPRPKVVIDQETNRLWNLLMGKEGTQGSEEVNQETEKWWENERKVFCGRADTFIARMHLIQGDRRFSKWKGSVVDSVIGVFLTQNVSDHLSSSAFMSLAARFPLKSTGSNRKGKQDATSILIEESIRWHDMASSMPNHNKIISRYQSTEHRSSETSGNERRFGETNCQGFGEELVSSQDSFDSSIFRSSSGSNSEAEEPTPESRHKKNLQPTSTNMLSLQTPTTFQDFYSQMMGNLSDKRSNCEDGNSESMKHKQPNAILSRSSFKEQSALSQPVDNHKPASQDVPSGNNQLQMSSYPILPEGFADESTCSWASNFFETGGEIALTCTSRRAEQLTNCANNNQIQKHGPPISQEPIRVPCASSSNHLAHQQITSTPEPRNINCQSLHKHQFESRSEIQQVRFVEALDSGEIGTMPHLHSATNLMENVLDVEERISSANKHLNPENNVFEATLKDQNHSSRTVHKDKKTSTSRKRGKAKGEGKNDIDWDSLRKHAQATSNKKDGNKDCMDSLDYEALRHANVHEISQAIKERGMNNMLAERMKEFLNRLVRDHGSIDLEWLRDIPPDKAKDYLLSIRGLGLKSVECVRLLTLHHLAFPVDTNVGRIAVRLGWVPLQPLPESLQLHLLELYPILESIQKYLWPRLCKLDQRTLYELHYQMITFGKVFCTKSKPNCNACPMRGECRHFASAFASARMALPGPEEKSIVSADTKFVDEGYPPNVTNTMPQLLPGNGSLKDAAFQNNNCEPIIEEPKTPEPESREISEIDIEDAFYEDPEEIPTIKLNWQEFTANLQNYMQENNIELEESDMSKALVALTPEAASIPTPKLKNISRLRTEHQVYELSDSHPLLEGMDRREPDDPCPYLLAIWTPGETANSVQPPESKCGSQESGQLCNENTCFSCNNIREANSQTVRGTLLIPCRTAMRGSFPLNGTYFQVNEVFADHKSSQNPIDVPRKWLWNLPRRTVYFGTSVSAIFRGLPTEQIQYSFWKGFVCVRGFDQETRAPRPLVSRLHCPASRLVKSKKENKRH